MKALSDRIWSGDFETVYESAKPYTQLLHTLASISETCFFETISEDWFFENDGSTGIRISYISGSKSYIIWTKRQGDFLNPLVLYQVNRQLQLAEKKFESSHQQESIYFISQQEKQELHNEGIVFDDPHPSGHFDFILYNVIMSLKHEDDLAYDLLTELNEEADEYLLKNHQKKEFKHVQDSIRLNLLEKINWQKVMDKGIGLDKLYELVKQNVL